MPAIKKEPDHDDDEEVVVEEVEEDDEDEEEEEVEAEDGVDDDQEHEDRSDKESYDDNNNDNNNEEAARVKTEVNVERLKSKEEISRERKEIADRIRNEARLTSGFGKNTEKVRIINIFWDKVWPALVRAGWTKTIHKSGTTLFVPAGIQVSTGIVADDAAAARKCFDRIKDVLDRINERRNDSESAVADMYRREVSRPTTGNTGNATIDTDVTPVTVSSRTRNRISMANNTVSNSAGTIEKDNNNASSLIVMAVEDDDIELPIRSTNMDLSWKEGGRKNFPKRSSSVGPNYQATEIPQAGTFQDGDSSIYCTLAWDPERAREKNIDIDKYIGQLAHNMKESAILLLAEKDYDVKAFQSALLQVKPTDGTNWSQEKRELFASEIFRVRKNLKTVAKVLDIPMKTCLLYYFGTFKTSDSYRLVKTVCAEERLMRLEMSEFTKDACAICGDGGSLLICDGCEGEYHMACMRPALKNVPEGRWECDECVDRAVIDARDYLIRHTKLFELKESKKRSLDQMDGIIGSDNIDIGYYEPTATSLEAVRKFASGVSAALSNRR